VDVAFVVPTLWFVIGSGILVALAVVLWILYHSLNDYPMD
jgi:hypothetical protein